MTDNLKSVTIGEMMDECELHCVIGKNSVYYECSKCNNRIKSVCKILSEIADSDDHSFIPAALEITK